MDVAQSSVFEIEMDCHAHIDRKTLSPWGGSPIYYVP